MSMRFPTRAKAKRDQIRQGAQRVFLQRGFAGASTDAIASEAGVSKQTLYAYYPNKETLLSGVLRGSWQRCRRLTSAGRDYGASRKTKIQGGAL